MEKLREWVIKALKENEPSGHWKINRVLFGDEATLEERKAVLETLVDVIRRKHELGITDREVLESVYSRLVDVLTSGELEHQELKEHIVNLLDPKTLEEIAFDAFGRRIGYANGLLRVLLESDGLKEHIVNSTLMSSFQGNHLDALYFLEELIRRRRLSEAELENVAHRALEALSRPSKNAARFLHLALNGEYGEDIRKKVLDKLADHHLEFLVESFYREDGADPLYAKVLTSLVMADPSLKERVKKIFNEYRERSERPDLYEKGLKLFKRLLEER